MRNCPWGGRVGQPPRVAEGGFQQPVCPGKGANTPILVSSSVTSSRLIFMSSHSLCTSLCCGFLCMVCGIACKKIVCQCKGSFKVQICGLQGKSLLESRLSLCCVLVIRVGGESVVVSCGGCCGELRCWWWRSLCSWWLLWLCRSTTRTQITRGTKASLLDSRVSLCCALVVVYGCVECASFVRRVCRGWGVCAVCVNTDRNFM